MQQSIRTQYETIFGEPQRPCKPHSTALHKFSKKWSWKKTLFELANEEVTKVEKVSRMYLTTVLEFLCYTIDKGYAEDDEERFQEQLRKQRRN